MTATREELIARCDKVIEGAISCMSQIKPSMFVLNAMQVATELKRLLEQQPKTSEGELSCPFCGHHDELIDYQGRITCRYCGASAGSNVWNTRTEQHGRQDDELLSEAREMFSVLNILHQKAKLGLVTMPTADNERVRSLLIKIGMSDINRIAAPNKPSGPTTAGSEP